MTSLWRQVVCLFILFGAANGVISYTFSFKENNLNNFLQVYYLNVQINISFSDDGYAIFTTSVLNVSPLHFSMFVNGRNCGIINLFCTFQIQPNEDLNIVVYKIDMQSNLIRFLYHGGTQPPDLLINGCSETMSFGTCAYGSQYSTDTRDNSYIDSICVCRSVFSSCLLVSNDTCISNRPFWNYNTSTTSTTLEVPTTSRLSSSTAFTKAYTFSSTKMTSLSTTSLPNTSKLISSTVTSPFLSTVTTKPTTSKMETTTDHTTSKLIRTTLTSTAKNPTTAHLTTITPSTTTHLQQTSKTSTSTSTTTTVRNSTNAIPSVASSSTTTTLSSTTTTPDMFVPSLKNLSDSGVGLNNVSTVLNETLVYSKIGAELNATQVMEISNILVNAANVPGLKAENSFAILQNLDNMLYVDPTTMFQSENSVQRVLNCLGSMVENTIDSRIEYLQGKNLGFSSKKIDCTNLSLDDGLLDLGTRFELINSTDSLGKWHSITVPLMDLCSTQDLSHVFFTIYRDTSLFVGQQKYRSYTGTNHPISSGRAEPYTPPPRYTMFKNSDLVGDEKLDMMNVTSQTVPLTPCARQTSLPETPVMSATVLNNGVAVTADSTSEATMAVLRFNVSTLLKPLHGSFKVTWWDVGKRQWAENRQCEIVSYSNGILEARCLHLTDFAIIVDAALNDPNVCDNALITLGYVVNGLSIFSLIFLTFFSISAYIPSLANSRLYSYIRGHNLARRDFLALAYHCDLLLFYVFFTVFSNQYVSGNLCTVMAAIMYAFLLCSLFLTIFQAIRNILVFLPSTIFHILTIILSTPAVLTISTAIPFVLSIFLLVFTKFFDRQDCFCWVRPDYVVTAIIIPVTILLLSTVICTSFMIYKVFCGMKRKFSQGGHHYDPNVITKIVSILVMQISLGLPWVLQFGTLYSPYTTFWHYLFTIVLGSQGTILFLIFLYKRYRAWQSESVLKSREQSFYRSKEYFKKTKKARKMSNDGSLGSSTDTFNEY